MAKVHIEFDRGYGQILVDGMPVGGVVSVVTRLRAQQVPIVELELEAMEKCVDLDGADLVVGGLRAPEALERALLAHLQAKYASELLHYVPLFGVDEGAGDDLSAVAIYGANERVAYDGPTFSLELVSLDEATSGQAIEPTPAAPADSTTPAGLCKVATDGERLGRNAWIPGA